MKFLVTRFQVLKELYTIDAPDMTTARDMVNDGGGTHMPLGARETYDPTRTTAEPYTDALVDQLKAEARAALEARVMARRAEREAEARRRLICKMLPDGTRVDMRLQDHRSNSYVFWSEQGNSYVIVGDDAAGTWHPPTGPIRRAPWRMDDGTPVHLFSINGIGEVRWAVNHPNGSTRGDTDAIAYFRLTYVDPFARTDVAMCPRCNERPVNNSMGMCDTCAQA